MSTVAQIMTKRPKSIGPKTSIASAAKTMRTARVGSLFVKKGNALVGVVTDTDIVRRAVASGKPLGKLTVEKIMTSPVCTIEENGTINDAQDMMADLGVRHLGVTKGGAIVGVISVRDLLLQYKRYAQSKISTQMNYSEPKITQD
ncbi:MAG: CBS domain-containing protein [Nitrospira sp.]|nr:CBS domain-containing protein [Nitrospira sp.]MBH0181586.1 CBS domain-containing protein [Nitrospira sp.]MBH0185506.1 CBS domain-containing protein [Nitrospira sp.]